MRYYSEQRIDGVAISPLDGFNLPDLAFLKRFPEIEMLVVLHSEIVDISAVNCLPYLKYLQLTGEFKQEVIVENFPSLRELRVRWTPRLRFGGRLAALRTLSLSNYRTKTKDLSGLVALPGLQELELVQTSISSLTGIDRFLGLMRLSCSYLPKLLSIAPIAETFAGRSLTTLEFDHCPKISDHYVVRLIKTLKVLHFNYCGEVQSLRFLNELPLLEDFRFVGSDVVDGDLRPCLSIPSVGFVDRAHYSHRFADFEKRT